MHVYVPLVGFLAIQQGGVGCSLTLSSSRIGAAAHSQLSLREGEPMTPPQKTHLCWASLCEGDGWLGGHQAGLVIRRLTAQHPERSGREAELWGHPSQLAGPAMLDGEMGERPGDSHEVGEV